MLYDISTLTTFSGLGDGFEMLRVLYDVDTKRLMDIC